MPFEEMLDTCVDQGIETLELGCGNWSNASHLDLDGLIGSSAKRKQFLNELNVRGISIAALNCSGNQLNPSDEGTMHKAVDKNDLSASWAFRSRNVCHDVGVSWRRTK